MGERRINAAAKGVLFTFLIRIFSFALSQVSNRLVKPKTLGSAALRLDLWCNTTVLFIGREGFRLALLRITEETGEGKDHTTEVRRKELINNVMWLSVPTGLCLTFLALVSHLYSYKNQVEKDELWDYKLSGIFYCLATAIEVMAEPYMISCLRTIDVVTRAKVEGVASVGKALSCTALLFYVENYNSMWIMLPGPITAFGIAQLVYAILFTGILYNAKRRIVKLPRWRHGQILPMKGKDEGKEQKADQHKICHQEERKLCTGIETVRFDEPTLRLSIFFTLQSILKHILTEGDRIVLSALVGSYDAGVYAMASSYGGIASRLIFQPLEENGRLLFSNHHASVMEKDRSMSSCIQMIKKLETIYCNLIKLALYVGFVFATFGSNYTSVLLRILAGKTWGMNREAVNTLSAFCMYTALLALNGMTEAFVYGVAHTGTEVGSLAMTHAMVGIVFYVTAPSLVLYGGGTVGLVAANSLCMVIRSLYSLQFAAEYFERKGDANYLGRNDGVILERRSQFHIPKSMSRRIKPTLQLAIKIMPQFSVMVFFAISYLITRQSRLIIMKEANWYSSGIVDLPGIVSIETAIHVSIGISCFFFSLALIYHCEGEFGQSLKYMLRRDIKSKIN